MQPFGNFKQQQRWLLLSPIGVSQRENPDLIRLMVSNRVNGLISNRAGMRTANFQMQFLHKFYP